MSEKFIGYKRFNFELTKKQKEIMRPFTETGEFGAVFFQVLHSTKSDIFEVRGGFLPEKYAQKVQDAILEYVTETKQDLRRQNA